MKELSIKQKAQRYNKAIYIAKKFYTPDSNNINLKTTLEIIFPELKESEDERIRKELIAFIKKRDRNGCDYDYDKWIAWLEKQGEPVEINQPEFDTRLQTLIGKFGSLSKEELASSLSFYLNVVQNDGTYKDEEKQGEQKLQGKSALEAINEDKVDNANKVEPKFKKDDWVIISTTEGDRVVQISSVEYFKDGHPRYITTKGRWFGNGTKARLWDVAKDAKNGDVLVCKGNIKNSNGIKYERICLFNKLDKAFFTLTKTSNFVEEYDIDVNIDYTDNTVPATKEQKEILFMTMKEAGYEYNAEKKDLKKIK